MAEKIMLIDGNSIINRGYYALPALTAPTGEPTGGVYGFLNIFFKMYDEEKPDYVLVAFDLPAPTSRHIKYEAYKGTRSAMPDSLRPQFPMLKSLLKKMGIAVYEEEGLEADDILGSLAAKSEGEGLEVVIISGDRDLLQIASDTIKIRIPKTKGGTTVVEDYYAKDVFEIYGVTPKEYIEVKALMGDSSDNIPGVPGIGEKTALKIITEYKSIEAAIENAADIKPKKASENIVEFKDLAYLSKDLATIITDEDIAIPEKADKAAIFGKEAAEQFKAWGFRSLLGKMAGPEERGVQANYTLCKSAEERAALIEKCKNIKSAAISAFAQNGHCTGISVYFDDGGYYIPFENNYNAVEFFRDFPMLFADGFELIAYDSKALRSVFLKENIEIGNIAFDTVLAAYVLDSVKSAYTYDSIASDYLGLDFPMEESVFGKGKSKQDMENANEGDVLKFACRHSEAAYKAYEIMKEKIAANDQQMLYYEIELPTAEVLASMENYGIKVNKNAIIEFERLLSEQINRLESEIYELTGEAFNINSPKQLGEVLFERLGLKGGKKTKTGYSTAVDVLNKIKYQHPAVEKVLSYRTLTKLKSTYCDGLLNVLDEKIGKIYSTFNQTVTATGRLSSTEPNLQNIPVRTELGRELRKVFIPTDESFIFADADYSQIELRVLAHMADDENMINAFNSGEDIHASTAGQVHNIPLEMVTPKMRSDAKAINFGIVYGIGAFSLSEDLGISVKEAESYINAYLGKYKGVKKFMDDSIVFAKENGFAKTLYGRRREIIELSNSNFNIRAFGERVAMNMPIQGSAADIMKLAMIKVYNALRENNLKSRIILQVHDELLLEVAIDEKEQVSRILKEEMESAVSLKVPMLADVNTGNTWFDTK